jgi:hypothetical protein
LLIHYNIMANPEIPQFNRSEPLDKSWYPRFKEIGSFQAYEYFDGDKTLREEERKKFLNGDIENPTLDYPKIDPTRLEEDEATLLQLKEDILTAEPNETVKQVYRWRLNEKIAELRMLKATQAGDMRKFSKYSEFVYGKPSAEIFNYTIQSLRDFVAKQLSSIDPNIQKAAKELNKLLPTNVPRSEISELPKDKEVARVREQTLKESGGLLNIEAKTEQYTATEIRDIFQGALNTLQGEGWDVVIDTSSKSGISVDQEHKTINIPESRQLAFEKLRTLVAHEVGTHVARRLNGERSKLQLLGLGLDRYEKGEEGIATMREQSLKDERIEDFAGSEGHLAISMAMGLDGTPRDFREVYEIMEKYFYLKALSVGGEPDEALKLAQTSAWNRTVRTYRGTNCRSKGVCFTKDIVYREGNIGVWEVVRENPDELVRFSVGKYDPANTRHIWILDKLGISEKDLEELGT